MKAYRCVVRSAAPPSSQTLYLTAVDCRAAANTAVMALLSNDNAWIEVWHRNELVLKRRKSNLYPMTAAAGSPAREEPLR